MNLIKNIKALLGLKPSAADRKLDFSAALRSSIDVVADFGSVLEDRSPEDGFGPLQSERRLPHPRATIMGAISFLQLALENSNSRAMIIQTLTPDEAQYVFSARYLNALESSRVFLDMFVQESQLSSQKETAATIADFLGSLSPEEKANLEKSLPPEFRTPQVPQ